MQHESERSSLYQPPLPDGTGLLAGAGAPPLSSAPPAAEEELVAEEVFEDTNAPEEAAEAAQDIPANSLEPNSHESEAAASNKMSSETPASTPADEEPDGASPQNGTSHPAEAPESTDSAAPSPPPPSPQSAADPASHLDPTLTGMNLLNRVVQLVAAKNGSDIHLLEGERPRVRIRGDLLPLEAKEHPLVTRQDIEEILSYALTPEQMAQFEKSSDIDFSLEFQGATGRVNVGLANGRRLHLVMRYLRSTIITIEQLGMDSGMLKKLASVDSGLIIVAGETSSGKTTTIAAMLDYINHTRYGSILTIENPVEYSLVPDKCLITRREIGRDTPDFHSALRASVRKNPDVLLIGEVRDHETANIAITAAETGIQSFCTLHAIGAIPAIMRLRNIMTSSGGDDKEFYQRLAHSLRGIISQQLVKAVDGNGVLPVYEILIMEYAEKNYLQDADFVRLEHALESDRNISMGHCVYRLWHEEPRRINEETVRRIFGDQFRLMMNRLNDATGWKPLAGI